MSIDSSRDNYGDDLHSNIDRDRGDLLNLAAQDWEIGYNKIWQVPPDAVQV